MKTWLAEFLGTALLVTAVVGSASMGTNLTDDSLLQLLVNMLATVLVLGVCITIFGPISGAHFNPVVTVMLAIRNRQFNSSMISYFSAQVVGGISGAVLANLMYVEKFMVFSDVNRGLVTNYLGEFIATSVLVLIIVLTLENKRESTLGFLVPAWIGAAYFATVSTSFANPAVTIARIFTGNSSGINFQSALSFIFVQFIAGFGGLKLAMVLSHRRR
jgi:arsenate reductase